MFKLNPAFLTQLICVLLYSFLMPCICVNKDIIKLVVDFSLYMSKMIPSRVVVAYVRVSPFSCV